MLKNKKILLVAPIFFGYESEIIDELNRQGATVDWIPDRPFKSQFARAVATYAPSLIISRVDKFNNTLLSRFAARHYDYVFVVNGQTLSRTFLGLLHKEFPAACFVLYMWDTFNNRPTSRSNLKYFDKVLTFDRRDSEMYGTGFRPLFYGKAFTSDVKNDYKYDLSFVGTIHSDRYAIISKLRDELPTSISYHFYLYLQARWVFYAKKLLTSELKGSTIDDFDFQPLTKESVAITFDSSAAVLDIEHPLQQGLTMRTFESLGSQKKLVTTNSDVINYDFYNKSNICVIDRRYPAIPIEFLREPYVPLENKINHKYSISGWVEDIFTY